MYIGWIARYSSEVLVPLTAFLCRFFLIGQRADEHKAPVLGLPYPALESLPGSLAPRDRTSVAAVVDKVETDLVCTIFAVEISAFAQI